MGILLLVAAVLATVQTSTAQSDLRKQNFTTEYKAIEIIREHSKKSKDSDEYAQASRPLAFKRELPYYRVFRDTPREGDKDDTLPVDVPATSYTAPNAELPYARQQQQEENETLSSAGNSPSAQSDPWHGLSYGPYFSTKIVPQPIHQNGIASHIPLYRVAISNPYLPYNPHVYPYLPDYSNHYYKPGTDYPHLDARYLMLPHGYPPTGYPAARYWPGAWIGYHYQYSIYPYPPLGGYPMGYPQYAYGYTYPPNMLWDQHRLELMKIYAQRYGLGQDGLTRMYVGRDGLHRDGGGRRPDIPKELLKPHKAYGLPIDPNSRVNPYLQRPLYYPQVMMPAPYTKFSYGHRIWHPDWPYYASYNPMALY